jgi:hypothetical protein
MKDRFQNRPERMAARSQFVFDVQGLSIYRHSAHQLIPLHVPKSPREHPLRYPVNLSKQLGLAFWPCQQTMHHENEPSVSKDLNGPPNHLGRFIA